MPRSLLAVSIFVMVSAACAHAAAPAPRPWVVSYLVRADGDSTAMVPSDGLRPPPGVWQWRAYDPGSGRDTLLFEVPSFPVLLRWDPRFGSVEFLSRDHIMSARWRVGAAPRHVAALIPDSSFCDFWADRAGYHLLTVKFGAARTPEGQEFMMPRATRWDQDSTGSWYAGAVDSSGTDNGDDYCVWPSLDADSTHVPTVTVGALLDAMRLGAHGDSAYQDRSWVVSETNPDIGLEVGTAVGDTYHATEPFVWIDRATGEQSTVYAEGQSHDDAAGQLAFAERAGYTLIVAEFSGAYPAVVDMRTGKVVFRVDRPSARAVWVPAPEGWPR